MGLNGSLWIIVAPSLTAIFATSISTGMFPQEWKTSRVSPVYKSGTRNNPSNYRPISVISTVAKIFEKIVYDQLYENLNGSSLLNACQSGFRSLRSTLTALLEATNSWSVNIDNGLVNGVIFIDLKKAFDAIDHDILLRKLVNYGVDPNSLRWFQSYLSGRTQKCQVNGRLSNSKPVTCGVPKEAIWVHYCCLYTLTISQIALNVEHQECLQTIQVLVTPLTHWMNSKMS